MYLTVKVHVTTLQFSCIRTEYGEIRSISPYSAWMRENTDQNNSEYKHFSRSVTVVSFFPKFTNDCFQKYLKMTACHYLLFIALGWVRWRVPREPHVSSSAYMWKRWPTCLNWWGNMDEWGKNYLIFFNVRRYFIFQTIC